jgi:hypothetical protein
MPRVRVNLSPALAVQTGLLLITFIILEISLHVASWGSLTVRRLLASPWEVNSPVIVDSHLGLRGNPLNPDHDARGYRNERALRQADIVTLGDSQTYGLVHPNEVWPRLLATRTRASVYNMALPGYGPAHSQLQLTEALALRPRLVIVAPYFGNDLYDSFNLTRLHPELLDGLSPGLRATAEARERQRQLKQERIAFFVERGEVGVKESSSSFRAWLAEDVQLYRLLRAVKYRLAGPRASTPLLSRHFATAAAALTPSQREYASPEDGPEWRTILTPRYRRWVLDDRDPRIRLGFEVMQAALLRMAEQCRAVGVRLLVVLIPTKESVFWPRVKDHAHDHPGLRELVAYEDRLRSELMGTLNDQGIEVVDVLGPLRLAQAQPYYEDVDGHPNLVGNQVIEAAVVARVPR